MKTKFSLQFQGDPSEFSRWVQSAHVQATLQVAHQLSISINGETGVAPLDPVIVILRENYRATITADQLNDVLAAVRSNLRIEAIKRMRAFTGLGLKDAKDVVEMYLWTRCH